MAGHGGIRYLVAGFWVVFAVFLYLFLCAQTAQRDQQRNLFDSTDRVRQLVQTLPPIYFRKRLAETCSDAHALLEDIVPRTQSSDTDAESLRDLVRTLLYSVATLAFLFDDGPRTAEGEAAVYAANLMVFVSRSVGESEAFPKRVRDVIKFMPTETDLNQLAGVLWIRPKLSSSTAADRAEQDATLQEFALPVPQNKKTATGRWRVLPGAPKSFVTRAIDGYHDVKSLPDWMDREGDFLAETREDLRSYFNSAAGSGVRSFISRPLPDENGDTTVVLNVHADREGILGPSVALVSDDAYNRAANERRELFFSQITPILLDLGAVLRILRARHELIQ